MAQTQKEKTDYKNNYNKTHYDRVYMYLSPKLKKRWESAASSQNMKLSEFVKMCVNDKIKAEI